MFLLQIGACLTEISACSLLLGNPLLQLSSRGIQTMLVWHLHPSKEANEDYHPSILLRIFNKVHSTDIRHLFLLELQTV